MKRGALWVLLFIGLALLAPLSSKRPDAVQKVLGLPGGVDRALKALGGIVVVATAMMVLLPVLRKLGSKR